MNYSNLFITAIPCLVVGGVLAAYDAPLWVPLLFGFMWGWLTAALGYKIFP